VPVEAAMPASARVAVVRVVEGRSTDRLTAWHLTCGIGASGASEREARDPVVAGGGDRRHHDPDHTDHHRPSDPHRSSSGGPVHTLGTNLCR